MFRKGVKRLWSHAMKLPRRQFLDLATAAAACPGASRIAWTNRCPNCSDSHGLMMRAIAHTLMLVLLFFSQHAVAQQCSASEIAAYNLARQRYMGCLQETGNNGLYCLPNLEALNGVVSENCISIMNCYYGYASCGGGATPSPNCSACKQELQRCIVTTRGRGPCPTCPPGCPL